jgi:hypothetical protein
MDEVTNIDFEELSMGFCPGSLAIEKKCLYVADTGDNLTLRREIIFHVFDYLALTTVGKNRPILSFSALYPDKPHDSESFAIHPKVAQGYILTKEFSGMILRKGAASMLFKINLVGASSGRPYLLEKVGELDVPTLLGSPKAVPTSMEFSPDGEWLYILTYTDILAIKMEGHANTDGAGSLKFPTTLEKDKNYFIISIQQQKQHEAFTFLKGLNFLVTSEGKKGLAISYTCHPKVKDPQ